MCSQCLYVLCVCFLHIVLCSSNIPPAVALCKPFYAFLCVEFSTDCGYFEVLSGLSSDFSSGSSLDSWSVSAGFSGSGSGSSAAAFSNRSLVSSSSSSSSSSVGLTGAFSLRRRPKRRRKDGFSRSSSSSLLVLLVLLVFGLVLFFVVADGPDIGHGGIVMIMEVVGSLLGATSPDPCQYRPGPFRPVYWWLRGWLA